jgi:hypothetical protein
MQKYSLLPFDTFNSSPVEHCLVSIEDLKLVMCSQSKGTRREKSQKMCTNGHLFDW